MRLKGVHNPEKIEKNGKDIPCFLLFKLRHLKLATEKGEKCFLFEKFEKLGKEISKNQNNLKLWCSK